jgi:hypothetical protein
MKAESESESKGNTVKAGSKLEGSLYFQSWDQSGYPQIGFRASEKWKEPESDVNGLAM